MEHDETMDEYVREVEDCLTRLEALKREECTVTDELRCAEKAGELDTCRICGKKWLEIRRAARMLNEQVDRTIMFRLPPTPPRAPRALP